MAGRPATGSAALGRYLLSQRLARGLSLRGLAARVGRAASTIQSWEQGQRMPALEDLLVLAKVFALDPGELARLAAPHPRAVARRLAAVERELGQVRRKAAAPPGSGQSARRAGELERERVFLRHLARGVPEETFLTPLPPLKRVGVLGAVVAGRPRLVLEEAGEETWAPRDLDVDYALRVEGDSMTGAGIGAGDTVWVKATDAVAPGETVVALLGGEEVTVKHLMWEGGRHLLRANSLTGAYPDIPLDPGDRILGVVRMVLRRPGPPPTG
ncbi:MAG: helix-turn-helix domain-containing protein [Thermaerobacter sp.]|jgi:repressor LexA|nr:helix-turn-helix domain-containing protein [Thermaerobacter sp.]